MDGELRGRISYEELRLLIFNYFKENQKLELGSTSIDYLKEKLTRGNDQNPFFVVQGEFGVARFDIPKEDIQKVFKSFLASKRFELSNISYGSDVEFSYKYNPNINQENEEKVKLDITYDGSIRYEELRQIIFDYYKKTKGIELGSISIDYLKNKLADNANNQPFFIKKDASGEEIRFDIPKEEIEEILKSYLASKNYELENLSFDSSVVFKYKQGEKQEQKATLDDIQINEILQGVEPTPVSLEENIPQVEPPVEPVASEEVKTFEEPAVKKEPMLVKDEELEQMAREKRRFTILQRERAMTEAQKGKNRSALMAGACILGAAVASFFNGQDIHQVLQHEMDAIYSWEALGQYIQDLGPLTTLLAAGAGGFIAKYFKDSKKFKKAQHEFEDFNASLEKTNTDELGGNENDKSR